MRCSAHLLGSGVFDVTVSGVEHDDGRGPLLERPDEGDGFQALAVLEKAPPLTNLEFALVRPYKESP